MSCEGSGDSLGELAPCSDSFRHVVREGSGAEDAEAEEVDVGLRDSPPLPSHVFTSRIIAVDMSLVKEYNIAVTQDPAVHVDSQSVAESHRAIHERLAPLTRAGRRVLCRAGRHRWQLHAAYELGPEPWGFATHYAARACAYCRTVEILE